MEKDNLIKKLEKTSLPEVEITSHKEKLRAALLNKYFREKRISETFDILKKFVPVGAVVIILIGLIFNNLISPRYNLARAREIAMGNPQIKEWAEKGAVIKDVEIIRDKAYVLIQPTEEIEKVSLFGASSLETDETIMPKEEFTGALAEIDLRGKKISKIEKITPLIIPLGEEEKEKAKEIAENNPEIQKIIPEEAKIKEIISVFFPQLKLIRENDSVKVVPEQREEKRARIIYELDQDQWEGEIDLIEGGVRNIEFLGATEE